MDKSTSAGGPRPADFGFGFGFGLKKKRINPDNHTWKGLID
jgi:hypothetical protein